MRVDALAAVMLSCLMPGPFKVQICLAAVFVRSIGVPWIEKKVLHAALPVLRCQFFRWRNASVVENRRQIVNAAAK